MTDLLFDLAFWCATPVWLLMIFAPRWSVTVRVASSPLTALPILVVYTVLVLPVLPELWALVTSPTLEGMHELTALADGAGAVWAQIIAWDLLIGQWIFLEARRLKISPWVTGPLLVFAILLSPFALPVFLLLRAVRMRGASDGTTDGSLPVGGRHRESSPTVPG
ncbi:ABA4-like family protein [Streptomyces sp. NPDC059816]|uniref:ABA4-like family protein n=1 Tax=Streptomyces sp. NPDC059816 TaxID=3346960 RepID=UPI00364E860C